MPSLSKVLGTVAVASALVLVSACGADGESPASAGTGDGESAVSAATGAAAAGGGAVEILLPFPEGLPFTPLVVAKEQGYFTDNGVEVTTAVADGSGYVTQQLVSGNVEFALLGSADIAVAASKRDDVRVLYCNQVNNVYRIMATKDSGVTDIAGLAGRSIGITEPGGGENQYVQAALADAGLSAPGDLTVLPVGAAGPQALSAIEDGTIDAYSSSFPDIASLTASGVSWVDITPERYSAVPGTCMVTTQEVLDSADGMANAKGIAKAWVDGQYFALENEDEAFDIVCGAIPEACANQDAAQALYDEALNVIRPDAEGQRPGEVEMTAWETVVEILSGSDAVPADLDLTDVVSGPSIDEVVGAAYADH